MALGTKKEVLCFKKEVFIFNKILNHYRILGLSNLYLKWK